MIPLDGLAFEHQGADQGEYGKRDAFLYYFELHQAEGASVDVGAYPVGRHHGGIFKEGDTPRGEYYEDERPPVIDVEFGELELSVPGNSHEYIGDNQEQNSPETLHSIVF